MSTNNMLFGMGKGNTWKRNAERERKIELGREMKDGNTVFLWDAFPALNQWTGDTYLLAITSLLCMMMTQYLNVPFMGGRDCLFLMLDILLFYYKMYFVFCLFTVCFPMEYWDCKIKVEFMGI